MTTDIFTKALPKDKFQPHRTALGFRTMWWGGVLRYIPSVLH
jgi:hypothetical protein